jgi:hypothetical protein
MAWPEQLNQFPLFTIDRITIGKQPITQSIQCDGRIANTAPIPAAGRYIWLAVDLPDCVYGDVLSVNSVTREVSLALQEDDQLVVGASFPLVDGYHSGHVVWMVLDKQRTWQRRRFEPRDAIATPGEAGYTRLAPSESTGSSRYYPPTEKGQTPPAEGRVVPGGWDHEHCTICMATISPHSQTEGYLDDEGNWVCIQCYSLYVQPHDLGFVVQPGE